LDSVRYINFYYEEATTNREKALGWILLAINQKDELKNVLIEIFSNIPILQLYSKEESYLWANRKEILEACDIIYDKPMYNACPLLDNFIEYGKKKEERKESRHLMRLLDNKSSEHFDADYQALQKKGLTPDNYNQGNELMARTYSIHEEGG